MGWIAPPDAISLINRERHSDAQSIVRDRNADLKNVIVINATAQTTAIFHRPRSRAIEGKLDEHDTSVNRRSALLVGSPDAWEYGERGEGGRERTGGGARARAERRERGYYLS